VISDEGREGDAATGDVVDGAGGEVAGKGVCREVVDAACGDVAGKGDVGDAPDDVGGVLM
jgi:hypothetical protein